MDRIDSSPSSSPVRPRSPFSWTVERFQRCGSTRPICPPRDLFAGRTPSQRRTTRGQVFAWRCSRSQTLLLIPLWILKSKMVALKNSLLNHWDRWKWLRGILFGFVYAFQSPCPIVQISYWIYANFVKLRDRI